MLQLIKVAQHALRPHNLTFLTFWFGYQDFISYGSDFSFQRFNAGKFNAATD